MSAPNFCNACHDSWTRVHLQHRNEVAKYKFTPSILRDGAVAAAEGAPGQTKP